VPDTPWFLVAKMDADEVVKPIHRRAILVSIVALSLILAAAAGVAAVAEREGDAELISRIADERNVTTVEELMAWLEEHQHPALTMPPIF
jgi:hypothetical protein